MHRLALLFGFVGPLVGTVGWVFIASFWMDGGSKSGSWLGDMLVETFVIPLLVGLWGYVIALPVGFLPAAATGALYTLVLRRGYPEGNPTAWLRGLIGAELGGAMSLLFGFPLLFMGGSAKNLAVLMMPGVIAGCLCCLSVRGRIYQWAIKP